ncbi:hypothetical protein FIBSPDRAFT_943712 [Athelia psychrophila]|uniref:Uncharacterized protein n=1 Tax=Athelia psychrophila TaxID=1759441 RepID=A0A166W2Z5_9AGAM|nr:hypothetical protein FIBSPDRAFT_943712 [Fibularhizoctonia sp. CBS 109695]
MYGLYIVCTFPSTPSCSHSFTTSKTPSPYAFYPSSITPETIVLRAMTQTTGQAGSSARRRSGSLDAYPASPSTLHAMETAELDMDMLSDSVTGADMLAAMEQDKPEMPTPKVKARRKTVSHSPDIVESLITPNCLRATLKTTPKADKVMQEASKRRAAQSPDEPFLLAPGGDSSSPGTISDFQDNSTMAPSSPLQNKSRNIYHEPDLAMDFNFPSVDLLSVMI